MAKLALYEERKGEESVEENIDRSTLELLGLEDVVDLTYSEYKSLLREKMLAGRMSNTTMTSEETEKLTDEYKRVKSNTGVFVVKANKSSVQSPSGRSYQSGSRAMIAPEKEKTKESSRVPVSESLLNITKVLDDINDVLQVQVKVEEDELDAQKVRDTKEQRAKEETEAEKKKGFKPNLKMPKVPEIKIPFFDKVMNYFKNIVLGGFAIKALNWLQDPKNQETIDNFVNFITDAAPLIIGGFIGLMALPIVTTILSTTAAIAAMMGSLVLTLGAFLINPVVLAALAAIGTVALIDKGIDMFRDSREGAEAQKSQDQLNEQLTEAGMTPRGMNITSDIGGNEDGRTDEQERIYQEVQGKRKVLFKYSEGMRSEFDTVDYDTSRRVDEIKNDPQFNIVNVYGNNVLTEEGEKELERIRKEAKKQKEQIRSDFDKEVKIPGSVMRGGVSLTDQVMGTGEVTTNRIDERLEAAEKVKPGSNTKTRIPGVGTITAGRNLLGMAETKYYDTSGSDLTKEEFDELIKKIRSESKTIEPTKPLPTSAELKTIKPSRDYQAEKEAKIEKPTTQKQSTTAPKPAGTPTITAIPITPKSSGGGSSSSVNSVELPVVRASDANNENILITKTIYNIVQ